MSHRFCIECTDEACALHQAMVDSREHPGCFFIDDDGTPCPSPSRAHNTLGCYRYHADLMPHCREYDDDLVCIGGRCCYMCDFEVQPEDEEPDPVEPASLPLQTALFA